MTNSNCLAALTVSATIFLTACTTVPRDIQTPSGPQAVVEGPLHILRVIRRTTTTGNRANFSGGPVVENVVVSCPSFTQTAIPTINALAYGYGEIEPDDLSMVDAATGVISVSIDADQRPLGAVQSQINVVDIDAPDSRGEQRVTLRISAALTDENGDDRWYWVASYYVMCLGNASE